MTVHLDDDAIAKLAAFPTPAVCNAWEKLTAGDRLAAVNREPTTDFLPEAGAICGRAVTVVFEPSDPAHKAAHPDHWQAYWAYLASVDGPKIVVARDLDSPACIGALWGEVTANTQLALGCLGSVADAGVRDLEEMAAVGFKCLARQTCVSHAHAVPLRWGCPVEVFGLRVEPGQLVHADRHGFMAIPAADEEKLVDATAFVDELERSTLTAAAREPAGRDRETLLRDLAAGARRYGEGCRERFGAG